MAQAMVPGGTPVVTRPWGLQYVAIVAGVAVLYIATGRLGLSLAHVQQNATIIWPPTGLSVAALVMFGRRVFPGVFAGAAATNAMIGTAPGPLLAIAVGNTLEAVVAATLLTRVARFDAAFARLRDVLSFLAFGVLASTLVSATVGVGALYLSGAVGTATLATVWLVWWLGDAGGATVVAPLLLVGMRGRPAWITMARRAEAWGALALLVALAAVAFLRPSPPPPEAILPALLVFPVIVWVGLRLGPRGAVLGSFLAGAVAVVGTAGGAGPFTGPDTHTDMLMLWAYVATMGGVAMILAAAVAEREDADRARQEGEREATRLRTQMQHVQRLESLGLLAGGIAHDFNNLLVPIRGNAELLRHGKALPADRRNAMLDEIRAASVQAADLCRQLLTYAGRQRPAMTSQDLAQIIEELAPLLRASLPPDADLRVVRSEVSCVEGDSSQLGQITMNLVVNAAESLTDGTGHVTVRLEERNVSKTYLSETFLHSEAPAGRYVVLSVTDDGSGMSPDTMERIFDPFYTTKDSGRGLGMASVLGIVQAHRGAIKVRSRPGEGTTFEVLLPAKGGATVPAEPRHSTREAPRPGGTVLLADDEDLVRTVTRQLLEHGGFEVIEARDGIEAVELYRERQPEIDAVLLDVSMPRLSGTDALQQILELHPEVPAVLMSGYDAGRIAPTSETPFVQKPFDPQALLEAVDAAVLGRRR